MGRALARATATILAATIAWPAGVSAYSRHDARILCAALPGGEKSNQCSEWRAAEAAEDSAFWAMASFFVAGFGVVGLLITIRQTRHANVISREIGQAQTRCYLSARDAAIQFGADGSPILSMMVKNSGQSPARYFQFVFEVFVQNHTDGWEWQSAPQALLEDPENHDIPAGADERVFLSIVDAPLPQARLSDFMLDPILGMTVTIQAAWRDVFELPHSQVWNFGHGGAANPLDQPVQLSLAVTAAIVAVHDRD